jgi:hypothetical protein
MAPSRPRKYALQVARLTATQIRGAFSALAAELSVAGARAEIAIAGGAALVLLYGARDSTKDVDAVSVDSSVEGAVRVASLQVAAARGLPVDWLNDAAKGYVHGLALGERLFESESLIVRALAPRQLLAMKLSAWRDDVDIEDARLLLRLLDGDRESAWKVVEPHIVPGRELKARYAFEDLWEAEHGSA